MGSLLEMMFVLLGSAILTVQGIKLDIENKRATMLALEGQNEATLVTAFQGWISDNFGTILTQYTASGNNPSITPPTIAQLVSAGNLKQAHKNGPYWGGSYATTMTMVPSGCTQAAGDCRVAFTMYPTTQLLRGGKPDVAGAAQVAMTGSKLAGTSQFGYSNAQNPGQIIGINGSFNAGNPLGSRAAAIMATNGPATDGNAVYIRRDGSLTWTGDQNVNGVSLHNVNSIDATGAIKTGGRVATNGLDPSDFPAGYAGGVRTWDIYAGGTVGVGAGAASGPGNQTFAAGMANNGDMWANGKIDAQGRITSASTIQAGAIGVPRAACSPLGAQASNSDGRGQALSCQNLNDGAGPIWMPVGGPTQAYNFYQVVNGTVVPSPPCFAGGYPKMRLVPQTFRIDTTAVVNFSGPGNGPWTIYITNASGSSTSNVDGQAIGTGEVETYCAY
ncbi:hypothetical protein OKW49_006344 [Paraburkholderia youngii]|uniref:hypothetical protein n=1 Tax=Paraburkholderia youngii TaxID=2782701 RepID=UPI003D241D87